MHSVQSAGIHWPCSSSANMTPAQRKMPSYDDNIPAAALTQNRMRFPQLRPNLRVRTSTRFGTSAKSQSRDVIVAEDDKIQRKGELSTNLQSENHLESSENDQMAREELEPELVSKTRNYDPAEYVRHIVDSFKADRGPPRWFRPPQRFQQGPEPLLLFIPGILGVGAELVFHYERLGRLFEIQSLHVPIMDRTPFEGLVSIVEEKMREEAAQHPRRPIYLVGDNYGGAVALAVAARNTEIDLLLVLLNPTTSSEDPTLQLFFSAFLAFPQHILTAAPFQLQSLFSDSAANLNQSGGFPSPFSVAQQLLNTSLGLGRALPEIVEWKLQMVKAGARFMDDAALHAITAEVLILIRFAADSGNEQLLPRLPEARRLSKTLQNSTFRHIEKGSISLLLEKDFDLASVVKGAGIYRQTSLKDAVANFVQPTEEEIAKLYESSGMVRRMVSPVFFSTSPDGEVGRGLSMIPSEGPILFVGCHSFLGLDLKIFASELLKERRMIVRGLAHPVMFYKPHLEEHSNLVEGDLARLFGAVPCSGKHFFDLLARGENVLVYPGGAREALHRKGEANKLFWPEQPEFVRLAAKFNATIVPVSAVGVDEMIEILMDYDEMRSIPVIGNWIMETYKDLPQLRSNVDGEVGQQYLHMPFVVPKVGPGRLYFLFGRPIHTKGKQDYFRDRQNVRATYHQVKEEIEAGTSYLLAKREQDPYRTFLPRFLYELASQGNIQAPTFTP